MSRNRKHDEWKRQRSLDELEHDTWPAADPDASFLVRRCTELRSVPIANLTVEDLRMLIGQQIGLQWLLPLAVEKLAADPLLSGDFYSGDLLVSVMQAAPADFWSGSSHRDLLAAALDQVDPAAIEEAQASDHVEDALLILREAGAG